MTFFSLPNELLLLTADYLGVKELNSLLRTCHRLCSLLAPLLLRFALEPSVNGEPTVCWAARGGYEALVRLQLDGQCGRSLYINKGELGMNPLILASRYGHIDTVKAILEVEGVDIDFVDARDRSAVEHAIVRGHREVVEFLLRRGACRVNLGCTGSKTLLHLAVRCGQEAVVGLLLDMGEGIDVEDSKGRTPLHVAVEAGREGAGVARVLVERGAALGVQNLFGETVLHWAARYGMDVLVEMMLERGVDAGAGDNNFETPLGWATEAGQVDVVELLEKWNTKTVVERRGHFCDDEDLALERGMNGAMVVLEEQMLCDYRPFPCPWDD